MDVSLIIFVKHPIPGKVKTRLASSIGDEQATTVYRALLAHTHEVTQGFEGMKYVYYAGEIIKEDLWSDGQYLKAAQKGNDLGARMLTAFSEVLSGDCDKALVIGSDCPGLTSDHLQRASGALNDHDVVLGPSVDGGYYLIGCRQGHSILFEDIEWSTPSVLTQTLDRCKDLGLSVWTLDTLRDIDDLEDLKTFPELMP